MLQGEKYDPSGEYTRKFVPELQNLDIKYLFKPWDAFMEVLEKASIILGENYPNPIVDLDVIRNRTLEAYKVMGSSS